MHRQQIKAVLQKFENDASVNTRRNKIAIRAILQRLDVFVNLLILLLSPLNTAKAPIPTAVFYNCSLQSLLIKVRPENIRKIQLIRWLTAGRKLLRRNFLHWSESPDPDVAS